MDLPLQPPVKPMLAKLSRQIPDGDGWLFEPKWDGFRCIVFRDGDEIELASRKERPFTRYFPELLDPLRASLPERCVVDGEIVVPDRHGRGLDFDALLQRIHPAKSRVDRLAAETPASFIAFDLLALGDDVLLEQPLVERRAALVAALRPAPPVHLTPASTDREIAAGWFGRFEGAGLDGIVAKRLDDVYQQDKRALVKVKHERTAECVVAGYRVHKDGEGVGSLLLGLNDDSGRLQHVGVAASFTRTFRRELRDELEPLTHDAMADHPWKDWALHDAAAGTPGGSGVPNPDSKSERLDQGTPPDAAAGTPGGSGVPNPDSTSERRDQSTHDAAAGTPGGSGVPNPDSTSERRDQGTPPDAAGAPAGTSAAVPRRQPGATSRWNAGKDLSWVPVRPERVAEVTFGQLENGRFRHGVSFVRWRFDRDPASCRYDQLDVADPVAFDDVITS